MMVSPHIKVTETDTRRDIFISSSGTVGGKIAEVFEKYTPNLPAAGNRRGVIDDATDVSVVFDAGDLDALYDASINPIRSKTGSSITLWGYKTCQTRPSELMYFGTRMLLIVLKVNLKEYLEDYLFELNNLDNSKGTCLEIISKIETYLDSVKTKSGFYDYVLDLPEDTSDAANRVLRVICRIQPVPDIEYIPLEISVYSVDVDIKLAA
jgi:phage tail sheath protein FI